MVPLKACLRDPIPELFEVARDLDAAVSAHLRGDAALAAELIARGDRPVIREWTESLWGQGGPWSRPLLVEAGAPSIPKAERLALRMPSTAEKRALIERDGHHCRFCGIPVIRADVRARIRAAYPDALAWGTKNVEQHAGFQALWLQYDHLVPHARGGTNAPDNMLVTCAPCNYGRTTLTLAEVGLSDPRLREPTRSAWDGLERFR